MSLLASFFANFQPSTPESRVILPLWVFWLLIGLIGALVILLLIRDKALRRGLKNSFLSARRRVQRARLESRIKRETKEREKALNALGQKAWSIGIKLESAADILKSIQALEQKKKGSLKESAGIDSEMEKLQDAHAEYRKSQEEKIKEQEEKKNPHAEHLSQTNESLKQAEADLSHIEKEIRAADKERTEAEKEITKIEENIQLSSEIKQNKIEELKTKVFEMTKKKEDLEVKRPSIEEQKSRLLQQKANDQNKIKEFDQAITAFHEEEKERQKVFEKEQKEWQKKKDVLIKKNKEMEEEKQPLFTQLGKALFEQRVESPELDDIYTRIETIDKAVQEVEEKRKELGK